MLRNVGCDVVFCPENDEMYGGQLQLKFDFGDLDKVMEGKFRPGHFSGVALVVSKLFNIVKPDNAYFGQKDWQQFAIIKQFAQELKFALLLHSIPTMRESDGLAMSSRNLRLSEPQRQKATIFYQALLAAKESFAAGKEIPFAKNRVRALIDKTEGVIIGIF